MACTAYNHFVEADDDTEVNVNLGEGAQQFMKLLKDISDVPTTPIKYSTDDTTEFICEEVMDSASKKAAWKIVASSGCGHAEKGARAVYAHMHTN